MHFHQEARKGGNYREGRTGKEKLLRDDWKKILGREANEDSIGKEILISWTHCSVDKYENIIEKQEPFITAIREANNFSTPNVTFCWKN